MERPDSTSTTAVVTDSAAAAVLLDAARFRFLRPYMRGERSTAEAAAEADVSVKDMAYRVKRMQTLGLLEATGERRRKGRPIRLYRAPPTFFVPFAAAPDVDLQAMVERLLDAPRRRLVAGLLAGLEEIAHGVHRWGWRLEIDAQNRESITPAARPDSPRTFLRALLEADQPAVYLTNVPLRLEPAEAKALQRELAELVQRYNGRNGSADYMLSLGLAREPAA